MDIAAIRAKVLADTDGSLIYVEQAMELAMKVGSMDLATVDRLRKAIAKRERYNLNSLRTSFVTGATEAGADAAEADELFSELARGTHLRSRAIARVYQAHEAARQRPLAAAAAECERCDHARGDHKPKCACGCEYWKPRASMPDATPKQGK